MGRWVWHIVKMEPGTKPFTAWGPDPPIKGRGKFCILYALWWCNLRPIEAYRIEQNIKPFKCEQQ